MVILSTTEAEYMTADEASKEAPWWRGLVGKFGIMQDLVRVHENDTVVDLQTIRTKENPTDMITKAILMEKFTSLLNFLYVI